jgi:hypothetical protein
LRLPIAALAECDENEKLREKLQMQTGMIWLEAVLSAKMGRERKNGESIKRGKKTEKLCMALIVNVHLSITRNWNGMKTVSKWMIAGRIFY